MYEFLFEPCILRCLNYVWKKKFLMILWSVFTIRVYFVFSVLCQKYVFDNLGQEFELNNESGEWERERYDLYLIQIARINYISRKNHRLWQRRVPVNCVQIIFHKIFNKKFYLPVAFGATHSYFCISIIYYL